MKPMKAIIPQPVHESYLKHRRQLVWQIILPMVLTAILFIALIVLIVRATLGGGDAARWAAVSTIWIVIPIMIGMLIFLALLGGMIYLLMRLLNITPIYTGQAQDFVFRIAEYVKRGADASVKPIFFLDGISASVRRFFGRK